MSRRMKPCYDGGRHRWRQRIRRFDLDGEMYGLTDYWCEKCGKWIGEAKAYREDTDA